MSPSFADFSKLYRMCRITALGGYDHSLWGGDKKTVPDIASPDERPEKSDIVFCVLQFPAEFHKCDEVTDKPNGEKPFSQSLMLKKPHLFLALNWLNNCFFLNQCKPLKTCSSCPDRRRSGGICIRRILFRRQGQDFQDPADTPLCSPGKGRDPRIPAATLYPDS